MFQNLTDLSMQRSALQALGFWLAYVLLGILVAAVAGGIAGAMAGGGSQTALEAAVEAGSQAGAVASVVFVAFIAVAICIKKSLGFGWYLLTAAAALSALFGGAIVGLVPAAFMTTRPNLSFHSPELSSP